MHCWLDRPKSKNSILHKFQDKKEEVFFCAHRLKMGPNEKIMALLGSLLVLLLSKKKTIDFKPCRDNSPYANPLIVQLSPNPLLVKSGAKINVNVYANLLKPLEPGSKVKLHLKEKKLWFDVTIPCLSVSQNYLPNNATQCQQYVNVFSCQMLPKS